MNGKKFVILFVGLTLISGALISLWIKKGYDSRPKIKIEEEKK